jgi:hypothetical protein
MRVKRVCIGHLGLALSLVMLGCGGGGDGGGTGSTPLSACQAWCSKWVTKCPDSTLTPSAQKAQCLSDACDSLPTSAKCQAAQKTYYDCRYSQDDADFCPDTGCDTELGAANSC